ncbi:hypothetical protein KPH14_011005 [Odynerus spinipes]|uniref:Uncharacterized protein n=1 Tax=Odynerus spinipes TaxID=1348599 RepID=A0AAD9RWA6_9HYME|nr:hypothetical protein KPH14_011005 [Odynerus spinipes]
MFLDPNRFVDEVVARTCHGNTKSGKSGPKRMLSHRCKQVTPPMGLMLGIPWGIERLKYSPEEDTGSDQVQWRRIGPSRVSKWKFSSLLETRNPA